ncbi:Ser recombinase [Nodularia phage vB_NspS-kac68v162]|jgi:site-specific DNA recombinase|uniref:Ser recombinase n=2 Tax=Ravarandavirus kac68v161 TaxID=2845690 RepID=A0A482MJ37_9CAUD|nr:DNA invertase [Nodularia phage vB_NspS-kac68v161]QBQ73832.1 Ser recombinase [Nodularia phage vB_NspS-kac68v161]QBQ74027.1 Ser recombinase [Nodularia phage vB_NspS-kac68v162]
MVTGLKDYSDCVGYCRVSTQKQFEEGHGLERYIAQLKSWGLNDNQIFWDIESGASDKRKGYNKVLDLIKSGAIKKLIIPCFDRFTRSTLQWEQASLELQKHNVTVMFLDGGSTDLTTPDDLFKMRILAAMSAAVRDKNKFNSSQGHKFRRLNEKAHVACFTHLVQVIYYRKV